KPDLGAIQHELLPVLAVVGNDRNRSPYTDQKLLADPMGMLAPRLDAWHVEDEEVPLRLERDRTLEFAHTKTAADIGNPRQVKQPHATNGNMARLGATGVRRLANLS